MKGRIIQIIPAPDDLRAKYEDGGEIHYSKVLCIALKEDGSISLIDIDHDGWIDEIDNVSNYRGIRWSK